MKARTPSTAPALVPIAMRDRLAVVFGLAVVLFGTYGVVGALQQDVAMRELPTWVDRLVPFMPAWVFAYGGLYPLLFAPVVAVGDRRVVFRAGLGMAAIVALAVTFWLWMPVTRVRPELVVSGVLEHCLAVVYAVDPPNNCFPSMHVATTVFAGLCVARHDRLIGALTLLLAGGVWFSSIAIAQHWFVDGLFGAVLAVLADALAYRGLPTTAFPAGPRRLHLWWVAAWVVLFLVVGFVVPRGGPASPM